MLRDGAEDISLGSDGEGFMHWNFDSLLTWSFCRQEDVTANLVDNTVIPAAARRVHQILATQVAR